MPKRSAPSRTTAQLQRAATANLVAHFTWVARRTPGMTVTDEDDLVWVDSGLACDTFNAICRARLTEATATHRIRIALEAFAARAHPFSWWVCPGDTPDDLAAWLRAAGLEHAETEIAMVADLTRLAPLPASPTDLTVRRVQRDTDLHDFARVVAANWNPPDTDVLRYYDIAAPLLLTPPSRSWLYVGYVGTTPVAASELTLGGGVVGLYNICTLDAYRGRGIGTAMTAQPLHDAQAQGHDTTILQAGAMGVNLYARLGFVPFGEVSEYKPRFSA